MTTKTEKLAHEIAYALSDPDALSLYESYTKKYSEAFLRKLLNRVMSIPDRKIKRSRGALFTFLIGQHENTGNRNAGIIHDEDDEYEDDYDAWN